MATQELLPPRRRRVAAIAKGTWGRKLARARSLMAVGLCATSVFGAAYSSSSQLGPAAAGRVAHTGRHVAPPGTNLIVNSGAEAGAFSSQGWDAVTIPAWQIVSGLPTVVRYGTAGFPGKRSPGPARRGKQLFVGGAGGTARLWQKVSLLSPRGQPISAGARFHLSAWLGGTTNAAASLQVSFVSNSNRALLVDTLGPVAGPDRSRTNRLALRSYEGVVPSGAVAARVTLVLATTLTNIDGPNAPLVGYNRAVADNLSLTVSVPVQPPQPLRPPASRVPRFQHVFLFYFENSDYSAIIGNRKQAPYLNSLLPRASLLANFFAEEHPSDGNYLALAGGSTFGIPLDDPLEENPTYTIHARNIGDLVDAAHETWKGYVQSANGPCDDTVHGYYWNDDIPMLYFADVRDRPAYCAAHVVPLEALAGDLASAATTPSFAWIGPNDCTDMEGCGIKAGDEFLATELRQIERSPAWTTQRSLAIITFDEDGTDHEHPAQRVVTVILGSSGVRRGYVSHVRYTHYSLLRTIEGALGLGALTANDRYAQPTNDVFTSSSLSPLAASAGARLSRPHIAIGCPLPILPIGPVPVTATSSGAAAGREAALSALHPSHGVRRASRSADSTLSNREALTAFVVNSASGTVTPIDLSTHKAGHPIKVGADPRAIALAPDGRTVYVVNSGSNTVTPIDTRTRRAETPIPVGPDPRAIAITPDGDKAYVVNSGSDTVTPIDLASGRAGIPIPVGLDPRAIAISPNGTVAYVLDWGGASVTPIYTSSGCSSGPIAVGSYPFAIAFAPNGATAYVANYGSDTVTPITVLTGRAGAPIPVGQAPDAIAVTPNGSTVEVVGGDSDTVTPISTATLSPGRPIKVGYSPEAITLSPRGATAYVVGNISGTIVPLDTSSGHAMRPVSVGLYSYPLAMSFAPGGRLAVVVDNYAGQVSLVDTATRHVYPPITVGSYPVAVAIAP